MTFYLKLKLSCFLYLICAITYAQDTKVYGTVTDKSDYQPLSYASVAYRISGTSSAEVIFTDDKGNFQFFIHHHEEGESLFLDVSYLGYRKESISFPIKQDSVYQIDIGLQFTEVEIRGITITDTFPAVVIKEDTIIYNVKEFTDGREFKLRDILKKTPGFEVTRDNDIYYNGEKVNELLVENERFFSGGTKLGVRYLPASVVSKIEVLEKYNRIGPLRGSGQGDRLAVNVHLNKEKTRFVFGDALARSNPGNRHRFNTNLFYYSPETRINTIWDYQNSIDKETGAIDLLRIFGFSPDHLDPLNIKPDKIDVTQRSSDNRIVYDQRNLFGIAQISHKITQRWKAHIVGNGMTGRDKSTQMRYKQYYEIDVIEENKIRDSFEHRYQFLDAELVYDHPDKNHFLAYNFIYGNQPSHLKNHERYQITSIPYSLSLSDRQGIRRNYHDLKSVKKWSGKWSHLLNAKWIIENGKINKTWEVDGVHIPGFYQTDSENIGARHEEKIRHENLFLLAQLNFQLTRNNKLRGFYRRDMYVSKGSSKDKVDRDLQNLSIDYSPLFNAGLFLQNRYEVGGLHLDKRVRTYALTLGIENHHSQITPQRGHDLEKVSRLRPRFSFSTNFENAGKLSLSYRHRFRNVSATHYWSGNQLNNFNQIHTGNSEMTFQSEDLFSFSFTLANKRIGNRVSMGFNHSILHDPIFSQYVFEDDYFKVEPYNGQKSSHMSVGMLHLGKQVSKWRALSTTVVTWFSGKSVQGGETISLNQSGIVQRLGLTYYRSGYEMEAHYQLSLNSTPDWISEVLKTWKHAIKPGIKIFFTDRMTFHTEIQYTLNRSSIFRQNHLLLNTYLKYSLNDRHRFELIGYNLLNHTERIRDQFVRQFQYSMNERLFPRYISLQYALIF